MTGGTRYAATWAACCARVMRRLTGEAGLSFLAGLVWAGNAWLVRWSSSGLM